jgi:arsenite methyltransferase
LEEHEFRIDNVIEDKFEYRFVDGTTMLNHYFIQLAFLESWKNLIPLEKQVDIFNRIEDNMNEIASEEGYFKLSIPFVLINCSRK